MSLNKLLDPVRISNIDDTIVSEMCNAGFSVDQDKPGVFGIAFSPQTTENG